MKDRKFLNQGQRLSYIQMLGSVLLILGILTFIGVAIRSFVGNPGSPASDTEGSVVGIAFLLICLSLALLFPDTFKTPDKSSYSTMRLTVFIVISVFAFITVKIGWNCTSFKDFNLDTTWGIIVTAALGSKAVQSLGENNLLAKTETGTSLWKRNTLLDGQSQSSNDLFHDPANINNQPPTTRPEYLK